MLCKTLSILLIVSSHAIAQTGSVTAKVSPPAVRDSQVPSAAEPYIYEVRFFSAREEFIRPLRRMKNYQSQPVEHAPFSTWTQLDEKSPIRIQKIETQVISAQGMSVVEVSEKQAFDLIQRAQGDPRTNIMYAPKVKAGLGATAVVSDASVNLAAEGNARSGVQIHLRTNELENGTIQADTEIVFRGPASDDLDRFEQTTISFSGILRSESLTMIVLPEPTPEAEPDFRSPLQRVSHVVRRRKPETPEPAPLLLMITVIAPTKPVQPQ